MKCSKCKNNKFFINIIPCCDDCSENGAYNADTEEYTYDLKIIESQGLVRDQVEGDGQCAYDTAFGAGCYMFICPECNHTINLAMSDRC